MPLALFLVVNIDANRAKGNDLYIRSLPTKMNQQFTAQDLYLIETLVRFWDFRREEDQWCLAELESITESNPFKTWRLVLALVKAAPSRRVLLQIGAGPLERLLSKNGPAFIGSIKDEVKSNVKLLYALSGAGIIGSESKEIQRLWDKYNLWHADQLIF